MQIVWIGGSAMACLLKGLVLVILGKALKGISLGFISVLVPTYLSEIIPKKRTGSALSSVQLGACFGALVMYVTSSILLHHIPNNYSFRLYWAIEAVPALLMFPLCFLLPESPKWLALHSKWAQAAKNLRGIKKYSQNNPSEPPSDNDKLYVIQAFMDSQSIACTFSKLLNKTHVKHTFFGILSQILFQITGQSTLTMLSTYVCSVCGLQKNSCMLVYGTQLLVMFVFAIFPVFLLDRLRRKDVLVFGTMMMGLAYFAIYGLFVTSKEIEATGNLGDKVAPIVLALSLIVAGICSATILLASELYIAEIYPGFSGTKGISVCMCLSWITNTGMRLLIPIGLKSLGPWMFLILGVTCQLAGLGFAALPETKNLSEREIESLFSAVESKYCSEQDNRHRSDQHQKPIEMQHLEGFNIPLEIGHTHSRKNLSLTSFVIKQTELETTSPEEDSAKRFQSEIAVKSSRQIAELYDFASENSQDSTNTLNVFTALEEVPRLRAHTRTVSHKSRSQVSSKHSHDYSGYSGPISEVSSDWSSSNNPINEYESQLQFEENNRSKTGTVCNTVKHSTSSPDSGTSFFYGNSDGSPVKGGITYEPKAFLMLNDNSAGAQHRPSNFSDLDFAPIRSNLRGGTFMRAPHTLETSLTTTEQTRNKNHRKTRKIKKN